MRLSDGITLENNGDSTLFIGNTDMSHYDDIFERKGYDVEQAGTDLFIKDKKEKNNGFVIGGMDEWCHWFRIYIFSDYNNHKYKNIEESLKK